MTGKDTLPYFSEAEIQSVLEWGPLIYSLEAAMVSFSAGEVAQPVRQMGPVPGQDAIIAAMPTAGEAVAVTVVTLYHGNAGTDVPTHQAVILIFDKVNGSPLATLDGRLDIEMRTAAGSAAAARKLAIEHRTRPHRGVARGPGFSGMAPLGSQRSEGAKGRGGNLGEIRCRPSTGGSRRQYRRLHDVVYRPYCARRLAKTGRVRGLGWLEFGGEPRRPKLATSVVPTVNF